MDVDLCIDLIFFPPSPLLVAAGTAASDGKNHKQQKEVVINGMVMMVIILFCHQIDRFTELPLSTPAHSDISSLSTCYQ